MTSDPGATLGSAVLEQIRVLAVAGIPVGVVVAGVGSRLAMFALRLTSPDTVIGRQSDDDFTIGEFTIGGTLGLMMLGASVGIVGVAVYQGVAPRLIGPGWFRRLTVAFGSGAVIGSMLVHADGIDFVVLKPMWFAIGLFVLLPAVFAMAIGVVVDRVSDPSTSTNRGRTRWMLPLGLAICFPISFVLLGVSAVVFAAWVLVRDRIAPLRWSRPGTVLAQACWLGVAALGLFALVEDVTVLA